MDARFHRLLYVFFVLLTFAIAVNASVQCIEKERQSLLALKQGFVDGGDNLFLWGNAENQTDCCQWNGVTCSNRTGHVVQLSLNQYFLGGTINPSLSELRHLNYLDLSGNHFYNLTYFPKFIASLTHLKYLDLSSANVKGNIPYQLGGLFRLVQLRLAWNGLTGKIPSQLGNLSSLEFLDLSGNSFFGTVPPSLENLSLLTYIALGSSIDHVGYKPSLRSNLEWVSHLASLKTLHLKYLVLSHAKNWIQQVSNLTHLRGLSIISCGLIDSEPWPSVSNNININSSSLASIDLSGNNLTSFGILFPWLLSYRDSIVYLYLSNNNLNGPIPKDFGNFSSLENLYLTGNQLGGEIPQCLLDLCSLSVLYLDSNNLSGHLEDSVPSSSGCANQLLQILSLTDNQIVGSVPDLSQFSSLVTLDISHNKLNGTISKGIGHLSNLEVLDVAYNSLQGVITEAHFLRLSKLVILDLSFNALIFNVSHAWVPPFQLDEIILASCKLGPTFPIWLQTQNGYYGLDISSAQISSIPDWFWDFNPQLRNLNLSHNQISGKFPKLQLPFFNSHRIEIDFSSNLFEGAAPSYLAMKAASLDISNNKFTDANSLLCPNNTTKLVYLDISNNQFSGLLPDCWTYFESLIVLNVENNTLSGKIPTSIGSLSHIQALHLSNNRFTGEIPLSLSKCKELRIFDVAQNNLAGLIPNWIGDELNKLRVLSLRFNKFFGSLPYNLCRLSKVQILDLSLNNISGRMPKCLKNLTALAAQTSPNATITYIFHESYDTDFYVEVYFADSASLIWKGREFKYRSTLGLVKSIDLSSNKLIGEIPSELMELVGLFSLNISRNMISGEIPATIGRLKSLDFLDLSRNHLFGKIPSELSQIDRLSVMDLSYNNLSGEIPHGTQLQSFDASTYMGNVELCGAPLPKICPAKQTEDHPNNGNSEDNEQFFDRGFFVSLSAGFSTGFWGVCSILFLKKSWRYAYFNFLSDAYDEVYVMVAVNMAKLHRRIRGSS